MTSTRLLLWVNGGLALVAAGLCLADPDPLLAGAAGLAGSAAIGLWFAERLERA